MAQPEGQDLPEELEHLLNDAPYGTNQALLAMALVHWTPHQILDMIKAHFAGVAKT
jgi:hypothetical protein